MGLCGSVEEINSIVVIGIDGAGKKTIVSKLLESKSSTDNVTLSHNDSKFQFHIINEVTEAITKGNKHFNDDAAAIVLCVDSADPYRMDEGCAQFHPTSSKEQLDALLQLPAFNECPLLVLANKQDHNDAIDLQQISSKLCLDEITDRQWYIQGCSAHTGEGLPEALDCLSNLT